MYETARESLMTARTRDSRGAGFIGSFIRSRACGGIGVPIRHLNRRGTHDPSAGDPVGITRRVREEVVAGF